MGCLRLTVLELARIRGWGFLRVPAATPEPNSGRDCLGSAGLSRFSRKSRMLWLFGTRFGATSIGIPLRRGAVSSPGGRDKGSPENTGSAE